MNKNKRLFQWGSGMAFCLVWAGLFFHGAQAGSSAPRPMPVSAKHDVTAASAKPKGSHVSALPAGKMLVYVIGAVRHPGLYAFALNARVIDAVRRAGGPTAEADLAAINLAAVMEDGTEIVIPTRSDAAATLDNGTGSGMNGNVSSGSRGRRTGKHRTHKLQAGEHIRLNDATLAELKELPGIGSKKAQQILAFRKAHGLFATLSQLHLVAGIGPKLLAKILPYLTLN